MLRILPRTWTYFQFYHMCISYCSKMAIRTNGKIKIILIIFGLRFLGLFVVKCELAVMTQIKLFTNDVPSGIPLIYMITPTFRRAEQIPELIRLGQTLMNVKNLLWIVAEDASKPSPEVVEYLARSGLRYLYLRAKMPNKYKTMEFLPKGVSNRNAGLEWIKKNAKEGVVYFGDDDNTYDIRLFEEIRWTKRVSMFPVGFGSMFGISSPIVKFGKLVGFYDSHMDGKKIPGDMAGFAVNVKTILDNPRCSMPFTPFTQEDGFLRSLNFELKDVELKADNCTKILVWHTRTEKSQINPHFSLDPDNNVAAHYEFRSSIINLSETNIVTLQKYLS